MAASVRIENDAFTDARMTVLAEAARFRNHYEALGRMAHLWRTCTATQQYVLSEAIVRAHLGKLGPDALVACGLGERVEGGIRIRGTKGRIEWLEKLRVNSEKGGLARAAKVSQTATQKEAKRLSQKATQNEARTKPESSPPVPVVVPTEKKKQQIAVSPPANGAPRQVSGPDGEFLRHFDRALRKTHGTPYMAAMARDRKIAREIIAVYGLPLACEMVEAFFREHARAAGGADSWIGKAKPDVPGFLGQIPNLIREYRFDAKPPTGADHATSR